MWHGQGARRFSSFAPGCMGRDGRTPSRRTTMSYKPKFLGHVNIFVRNAERSQQWYADVLGLHTYDFVPGRAAFMSADLEQSHEVALIEVGDHAPGQQKG